MGMYERRQAMIKMLGEYPCFEEYKPTHCFTSHDSWMVGDLYLEKSSKVHIYLEGENHRKFKSSFRVDDMGFLSSLFGDKYKTEKPMALTHDFCRQELIRYLRRTNGYPTFMVLEEQYDPGRERNLVFPVFKTTTRKKDVKQTVKICQEYDLLIHSEKFKKLVIQQYDIIQNKLEDLIAEEI